MKKLFPPLLYLGLCLLFSVHLSGQVLTGLGSKWNDEFTEWIIFTEYEEVEGDLNMTWRMQNNWTSFDYRIEEASGSIKTKWGDNPTEWETRGDGEIITARMRWKGDPREWRITNNDQTFYLKSKWGNNPNVWLISSNDYGYFEMYMTYKNDFREWDIVDELSEEVSLPMKMTMVFLVMYNCVPK